MKVGDLVLICQTRPGGRTDRFGLGTVAKVTARKVTLTDGSEWRRDGYAWGSQPTRGLGRSLERRIERVI